MKLGIKTISLITALLTFSIIIQGLSHSSQNINYKLDENYSHATNLNEEYSNITLSLSLDDSESEVSGNFTINYYNNEDVNLSSIPFHIYPSGMNYDLRPGNILVHNVTTGTEPRIPIDFNVISAVQLMWVNLDTPLAPGERIEFTIEFITVLPDGGLDRANSNGTDSEQNRIYTFASAYPIPCVYDEADGWNTDPYLQVGDPFYLDMAYYDVYIKIGVGFVVAATGALLDATFDNMKWTYHYNPIYPVREFTFAASKYFIVDSQIYNGVNVSTYYLPSSIQYWNGDGLLYSVRSLQLFNQTFGEYPYPTLNVVESHGNYGGMEYPCQVYVAHSLVGRINQGYISEYYLEVVFAHEIAHQWWYQLVGVDEIDQGFLDEGLAVWSHNYYGEIYHGSWDFLQIVKEWDYVRTYYHDTGENNTINQTLYGFEESSVYYYTAYHKTPLLFQKLRVFLGDEVFFDGLRSFFETSEYENVFLTDFIQSMEDAAGYGLDWYFIPWFNNPQLPDYYFASIEYYQNQKILNVSISDANMDINPYTYSQKVPLRVETSSSVVFMKDVWVNGSASILIQTNQIPTEVNIIITPYFLLQLDDESTSSISSSEIEITNKTIPITQSTSTSNPTTTSSESTTPSTNPTLGNIELIILAASGIGIVILIIVAYKFRGRA